MTGFAERFASAISSFCTTGTRSIGISTPRSPRATMIASAAATISVMFVTACAVSIFATTGRPVARTRARSSARRTKETPTRSTPCSTPKRRSSSSFGVSDEMSRCEEGRLTPLPAGMSPPTTTRACAASITSSCMMPSASSTGSPARTVAGNGRSTVSPGLPRTGAFRRSFGPPRSWRIAVCRSAVTRRMVAIVVACSACVPCEKFRRKTSTPAFTSAAIIVSSREAGPRVATTRVRAMANLTADRSRSRASARRRPRAGDSRSSS